MKISEQIEINPEIMLAKPVFKETGIPVELILRKLGEGISESDPLEAYHRFNRQDILAAMTYAAETMTRDELIPTDPRQSAIDTENAISC